MLELSRSVTDDAEDASQGPNSINSVQNGFLLTTYMHTLFDQYRFGINPDDNYRIVPFTENAARQPMRPTLWINTEAEEKHRPSDAILREHYKQCVLANVKGAGERPEGWMDPEDEHDLSDYARWGGRMISGGKSRFELELGSRLYSLPTLLTS